MRVQMSPQCMVASGGGGIEWMGMAKVRAGLVVPVSVLYWSTAPVPTNTPARQTNKNEKKGVRRRPSPSFFLLTTEH